LFAGIAKEALVCLAMFGFCLMMFAEAIIIMRIGTKIDASFQKIPVL
jgi:hypothetical protein